MRLATSTTETLTDLTTDLVMANNNNNLSLVCSIYNIFDRFVVNDPLFFYSYEITPKRLYSQSNDPNNYNIDDLHSEDSTDEDDRPRKPIPSWACGRSCRLIINM